MPNDLPIPTRSDNDVITVGIDSSTKSCGIAIYRNGEYERSFTKTFEGTFDVEKLKLIIEFFNEFFADLLPDIVIIEEPLAIRNGRITRHLNLLGGAIFSSAYSLCQCVDFIHNKTVKKLMGVKTKEDSVKKAKGLLGVDCQTNDESDAILIVESYKKIFV